MKKIILGYIAIIFLGAFILTLPISSRDGIHTSFENALFTSTSATCVTGLVVQDTATYWSLFGQIVILCLIEIGGLGFMTLAVCAMTFTKKNIGLQSRYTLLESINAPQMAGIVKMARFTIRGAFLIEGVGALLLATRFVPRFGVLKGIYFSVFHSVSAFCNAGFDIMGTPGNEYTSLTEYSADIVVNITVMLLIVIGGLGFFVWADLMNTRFIFRRLKLHSKIVLVTTAMLIVVGAGLILIFDIKSDAFKGFSVPHKIIAAFFQSVTARTAGFNTVDLTKLSDASVITMIVLMLIGGSPSSTAGGFKTTTLAVLIASIFSELKHKKDVEIFKRRIEPDALRHVVCLIFLYMALFSASGAAITWIDGITMKEALFETASAIGTVGVTLGVTPFLRGYSHLILICLMFFGRVGGLTLLLSLRESKAPDISRYPEEQITIG